MWYGWMGYRRQFNIHTTPTINSTTTITTSVIIIKLRYWKAASITLILCLFVGLHVSVNFITVELEKCHSFSKYIDSLFVEWWVALKCNVPFNGIHHSGITTIRRNPSSYSFSLCLLDFVLFAYKFQMQIAWNSCLNKTTDTPTGKIAQNFLIRMTNSTVSFHYRH